MRTWGLRAALAAVLLAAALPLVASAHPERPTTFPPPDTCFTGPPCAVPAFRDSGPSIVVCKGDSRQRILAADTQPPPRRPAARKHRTGHRVHRRHHGHRRHRHRGHHRAGVRRHGHRGHHRAGVRRHRHPQQTSAPLRHSAYVQSRLAMLGACRFHDIQAAVDAAANNTRIQILPGVYDEAPSRAVPLTPAACQNDFAVTEGYGNPAPPPAGPSSNDPPVRPNFAFQHDCPNGRNLIAVIGDQTSSGRCNAKCNLQIDGMGMSPGDVLIEGDRHKADVIRADRADGFGIRNLEVRYASFNGIDVVETNGFHIDHVIADSNQNYGILSFTSDHGLYENVIAYGNGDSGVYPGSDPKGCAGINGNATQRYSIELRNIDSYHNTLGYSGTAGNSTWIHDSRFHDNATGISTDSFASGHPGMPQQCAKWESNQIYSNNYDLFNNANQSYCASTPFANRRPDDVCPQFQVPEGTGIIMYGANQNLVRANHIYDNWRSGVRLFWVPASIRGDNNPADQTDTSNANTFTDNAMGTSPSGQRLPNGHDFTWDSEGTGNCAHANTGAGGGPVSSEFQALPDCPGSPVFSPGNPTALAAEVPCAAWDPQTQPNPPGCTWFTLPSKPQ